MWREEGRLKSKTFPRGPEGKRKAEALDLEVKLRKKRGEALSDKEERSGGIYLDELGQVFLDAKRAIGMSLKTRGEYARLLNKHFVPALGDRPVAELTTQDFLRVVDKDFPGRSQVTRSRYLSLMKVMLNYAVDHGLITENPLNKWSKGKEAPRQSLLTLEDLRKITANASPHLAWGIEVAWNLGARPGESELLVLRFEHVDWANRQVRVYGRKTKTPRIVDVSAEFIARLREKQQESVSGFIVEYQGAPLKKFRGSLKTACRKAGIEYKVVMYDIRHLYATTLLNAGGDLAAVSALMGHSSTQMTANTYCHVVNGARRRAAALLPSLQPEVRTEEDLQESDPPGGMTASQGAWPVQ